MPGEEKVSRLLYIKQFLKFYLSYFLLYNRVMNPKDFEQGASGVPDISKKTSNAQLKKYSSQRWISYGIIQIASDIVINGKELLVDWDWELVLGSIKDVKEYNNRLPQFGEAAVRANGARFIGGLAAHAGWSMHDPPVVCLSGKYLAHVASLEDFKTAMIQAAVSYGEKTLLEAKLLMKTLDFLLELQDRNRHRDAIKTVASLLGKGNIEEAYNIIKPRDDLVRRR